MADTDGVLRVCAVQAAPVFLDRDASVDKACALIAEAGAQGAELIGFPEGFVPAHPLWFHFHPATAPISLALDLELAANAVPVPGPETEAVGRAAAAAGACVVLGVCEKDPDRLGTLFNTQVFLGADGSYLGKHQKLVPTVGERLVHAGGSGATLGCVRTHLGPVSGLVCGENWNPLALFALIAEQTRLHVMSWPPHFGPAAQAMRDRTEVVSRAYAHMASAFVVSACGAADPAALDRMEVSEEDRAALATAGRCGGSLIAAPDCSVVAGPAGTDETHLYADVDLRSCAKGRLHRDLVGHYNRPDVFELRITRGAPQLVSYDDPS